MAIPDPIAVPFAGSNHVYRAPEGVKDMADLPVHRDGAQHVTCWKIHWLHRLKLLFTGRVWVLQMSHTMPPMTVLMKSPVVVRK